MMHRLLERQLKKIAYKDGEISPEQAKKFIRLVDQAYMDADGDRKLLEHALDVSSKEMQNLYKELEISAKKEIKANEEKYERLVENLKNYYFFYTYDTNRVFTYLSDSISNILGYNKEEFLIHDIKYFSDDLINKKAIIYSKKSLIGEKQPPFRVSVYHKDGTLRYLELTEFPHFDKDGQVKEVEGIARDVTREVKYANELQKVLDLQKNIVFLSSGKEIAFVNKTFLDFLGYRSLEEFLKHHSCICEKFVRNDHYFHLGKVPVGMSWIEYIQTIESGYKRIVSIVDKNRLPHAFTVSVSAFSKDEYIVSLTDISSTVINQINLENKVLHDKLTQAYSREYFDLNYKAMIEKSKISGEKLGFMMLDIDHFKKVNDTYGHNVGDDVLKRLVSIIKSSIRFDDILIRWGGEEFIVLALLKSTDNLHVIAENIRKNVKKAYFNSVEHITISIGVTFYHENEEIKETIKRADDALYKAKESGRNRIVKSWS